MVDTPPQAIGSTVLGYPRIGPNRELKRALEQYWAGALDVQGLRQVARDLRLATWSQLAASGLDSVPSNFFSYYDHVLDTTLLFDAIPQRYRDLGLTGLDTYFAMARGRDSVGAMELTKWFDTNYHYLVPEIGADTVFSLAGDKPVAEYLEARSAGVETRPVLLGPVTFLLLSKGIDGFVPLDALDSLVDCYAELLGQLAGAGAAWVQLDEPAFVADRSDAELVALARTYDKLANLKQRPRILVAGYFGEFGAALPVLAGTPVEGIAVDLVAGSAALEQIPAVLNLRSKTLVAGVVEGRNIWRTDLGAAASKCAQVLGAVGELGVSTSCSLLHVPYDLSAETSLDPLVAARLAFARQKVEEVVLLGKALQQDDPQLMRQLAATGESVRAGVAGARRDEQVRARLANLGPDDRRRVDYSERAAAQAAQLGLPPLATTTIGSFPQTAELRKARADLRAGHIDDAAYQARMREEIERVVRLQEELGFDVLVHGEPERNDMVQYFGELLEGFAFTENGWVQSYGSRCVRPPILHGDVSRREPMTVSWAAYAQSLTTKPMKGMLTGPVTILAWSFVRDDQPLGVTADQVALALRDEIGDLEAAGIGIIQVDEAALRELLPLRAEDRKAYLDWAVGSFRLATSGAAAGTQIHTHLCYSEFGDVIEAIDSLDADVTTIEAARSKMEVLADLAAVGFSRGVGPGVYDIHSPRVPDEEEMTDLLRAAVRAIPADRVWANPDCGLKTRGYAQAAPALQHLVAAARKVRSGL